MILRITLFYVEAYLLLTRSMAWPAPSTQQTTFSSWPSRRCNCWAIPMQPKSTPSSFSSYIEAREWRSTGATTSYVPKSRSTSWWPFEKREDSLCSPSDWCFYLVITREILPNWRPCLVSWWVHSVITPTLDLRGCLSMVTRFILPNPRRLLQFKSQRVLGKQELLRGLDGRKVQLSHHPRHSNTERGQASVA